MNKVYFSKIVDDVNKKLSGQVHITKESTELILEAFLSQAKEYLLEGNAVNLKHFIQLEPKTVKARTARNPATGEAMHLPEKKVVRLKVLKPFSDALNADQ